jgi:hypothetical protein
MGMLVTELPEWDFISYDPRFAGQHRMISFSVPRNEDEINLLKERINGATAIIRQRVAELTA